MVCFIGHFAVTHDLSMIKCINVSVGACFLGSQTDKVRNYSLEHLVLPSLFQNCFPLITHIANNCTAAFIHDSHNSHILGICSVLYYMNHMLSEKETLFCYFHCAIIRHWKICMQLNTSQIMKIHTGLSNPQSMSGVFILLTKYYHPLEWDPNPKV